MKSSISLHSAMLAMYTAAHGKDQLHHDLCDELAILMHEAGDNAAIPERIREHLLVLSAIPLDVKTGRTHPVNEWERDAHQGRIDRLKSVIAPPLTATASTAGEMRLVQ